MIHPSRDSIYTPAIIAALIAERLPEALAGKVLDPAAGEGALLKAAQVRFGKRVEPLAIDLDPSAVRALSENESWTISRADTLSARSRRSSSAWRAAQSDLAAVLLNPPFSHRGNGGKRIMYGEFEGRVSPSVEFVHTLLSELNPVHGFWAILPDGALDADRHRGFWGEVNKGFEVSRLTRLPQNAFPDARVSTSLVRILRRDSPNLVEPAFAPLAVLRTDDCTCVEIIRGRIPVHRVAELPNDEPVRFVHSTDLGRTKKPAARLGPTRLSDEAPLVLIVRVGAWAIPTVIDVGRVILSDCLIALRPRNRAAVSELVASLEAAEDEFKQRYKGTGAKYLTLENVSLILQSLGWRPTVAKAGSKAASCDCHLKFEDSESISTATLKDAIQ